MWPCSPPTLFQSKDWSTSTGMASARLRSRFPYRSSTAPPLAAAAPPLMGWMESKSSFHFPFW